ncbi:MAG: triose-phosphate isomerase [Firmicutes bacterium]|nr:triose-phosphate isomerase [Bacillota bacterium]
MEGKQARTPLIAGNWKMHKTVAEAVELVEGLLKADLPAPVEVLVCPPFTALSEVAKIVAGTKIKLGAQNLHWEKQGAYTGEVSPVMLAELGCEYVIIGHSERRQYFGETDEAVNRKVKAALEHGIKPIICVGESLAEREAGVTEELIQRQVRAAIAGLSAAELASIVIAYEPIWAIGTGKTADGPEANRIGRLIRETIAAVDRAAGEVVRILYGGSVKPENFAEFAAQSDIDGALVGGASLKADQFAAIVRVAVV